MALTLKQRIHAVDVSQLTQAPLILRVCSQQNGEELRAVGLSSPGMRARREQGRHEDRGWSM